MKKSHINEKFKSESSLFSLPRFYKAETPSIFSESGEVLLSKEILSQGFTLEKKSTDIDFSHIDDEINSIDITEDSAVPKYTKLGENDIKYFKQIFSGQPKEAKIREAKKILHNRLNTIDCIDSAELSRYLDRVISELSTDQLSDLQERPAAYSDKIETHIQNMLKEYRAGEFKKAVDTGKIICKGDFRLVDELPITSGIDTIGKSLYTIEGDMNKFEKTVIEYVASCGNVVWWHRNLEKREFAINGYNNDHYPDFIIKTLSGKIILLETKADFLDGSDTQYKADLGEKWSTIAGNTYLYFLVYETKSDGAHGVYSFDEFKKIVSGI